MFERGAPHGMDASKGDRALNLFLITSPLYREFQEFGSGDQE